MCANTCPNEQYIIAALNREAPEKIPSFCQSIMSTVAKDYLAQYEDDIQEDQILMTEIGDFTLYKAFGYSSHWSGAPAPKLVKDAAYEEFLEKKTAEIKKTHGDNYTFTNLGSIHASNNIASWFVEPGITNEADLRFLVDHLYYEAPNTAEIERWREGRLKCMDADFVPFASSHVVSEPGNQIISFGLIAKLMRKNPALLHEFYNFLTTDAEMQVKGAVKAGYKCFCTADDCAYKTGPMLSPKQFREFVVPYSTRVCSIVREAKGVIFMHTDGFIDPIMDCFVDAGYHAIQPLEPTSGMTIERVKRLWGDKLACIGNVDTTNTLSFGKPQDARDYVHRCFREASATMKNGRIAGYVFAASGSLHNEVKLPNVLAMMDEYKKIRDGKVNI